MCEDCLGRNDIFRAASWSNNPGIRRARAKKPKICSFLSASNSDPAKLIRVIPLDPKNDRGTLNARAVNGQSCDTRVYDHSPPPPHPA